jgi:hypothetical protein
LIDMDGETLEVAAFEKDLSKLEEKAVIGRSAGDERLDRCALETVRRSAPFLPFPGSIHGSVNFALDLNYKLN